MEVVNGESHLLTMLSFFDILPTDVTYGQTDRDIHVYVQNNCHRR